MTHHTQGDDHGNPGGGAPIPQGDALDALLREWHEANRDQAAAQRDALMRRVAARAAGPVAGRVAAATGSRPGRPSPFTVSLERWGMFAAIAAVIALMVGLVLMQGVVPGSGRGSNAARVTPAAYITCDVPEGGRLDAIDLRGQVIGACPLTHTDVKVDVSGFVARVTLEQRYTNPYPDKIEAVYTFPMSEDGAVDRMEMIIGDRVIIGEVKERDQARRIYESAKAANRVASLLEQERPNIFTQSVANIEPGAEVIVRISYVELVPQSDGAFTFDFPMVVAPRYIPGSPTGARAAAAAKHALIFDCADRRGVVLLAPGSVELLEPGDLAHRGESSREGILRLLESARPVTAPTKFEGPAAERTAPWYRFFIRYADGSGEMGVIDSNGLGHINGRWFLADLASIIPAAHQAPHQHGEPNAPGANFAHNTDQVPDASRITPTPMMPGERAGHDISIEVTIDTGGPGIAKLDSTLHAIKRSDVAMRADGLASKSIITLAGGETIPNKDFILTWEQTADTVENAAFVHAGELGSYLSVRVTPPGRVEDAEAAPRELVFVLDTSGSMSGFPIEKAKAVMTKAMAELRAQDTFNIITFSGHTSILWPDPKPGTAENITAAQNFINTQQGGGGTEMMSAIHAALKQTLVKGAEVITARDLLALPADGRKVSVSLRSMQDDGASIPLVGAPGIEPTPFTDWLNTYLMNKRVGEQFWNNTVEGRWEMRNGRAALFFTGWGDPAVNPIRIVCFMTDGHVGNDMAIIDAIQKNRATTRVFSFGIGNAPNRYLLAGMAKAGLGEVEFVSLDDSADAKAQRFAERIRTPVLTNIAVEFGPGFAIEEALSPNLIGSAERIDGAQHNLGLPDGATFALPDLFDVRPIVVHARFQKTRPELQQSTITIRGNTAAGPFTQTFPIDLPDANSEPGHDVVPTLWARQKVEQLMNTDLAGAQLGEPTPEMRAEVVALGERFGLVTQYTSFVAVDMARVTIDGEPRLVHIPIEMPDGMRCEGIFGGENIRLNIAADIPGTDPAHTDPAANAEARMRLEEAHKHWAFEQTIAERYGKSVAMPVVEVLGAKDESSQLGIARVMEANPSGIDIEAMAGLQHHLAAPGSAVRNLSPGCDDVDVLFGGTGPGGVDVVYAFEDRSGSTGGAPGSDRSDMLAAFVGGATEFGVLHDESTGHSSVTKPWSGANPSLDLDQVVQQTQQGGGGAASVFGDSDAGLALSFPSSPPAASYPEIALKRELRESELSDELGELSGFTILGSVDASDNPAIQGATIDSAGAVSAAPALAKPASRGLSTAGDGDRIVQAESNINPVPPPSIIGNRGPHFVGGGGAVAPSDQFVGYVAEPAAPGSSAAYDSSSERLAQLHDHFTQFRDPAAPEAPAPPPSLGDIPIIHGMFEPAGENAALREQVVSRIPIPNSVLPMFELRESTTVDAKDESEQAGEPRTSVILYDIRGVSPAIVECAEPRPVDPSFMGPPTPLGSAELAQRIASIITRSITPDRWAEWPAESAAGEAGAHSERSGAAAEAHIRSEAGAVIVEHDAASQAAVADLLTRLAHASIVRFDIADLTPSTIALGDGSKMKLGDAEAIATLLREALPAERGWLSSIHADPASLTIVGDAAELRAAADVLASIRSARLLGEGAVSAKDPQTPFGEQALASIDAALRAGKVDKALGWAVSLSRIEVPEARIARQVTRAMPVGSTDPAPAIAVLDAFNARVAEVERDVKIARTLAAELYDAWKASTMSIDSGLAADGGAATAAPESASPTPSSEHRITVLCTAADAPTMAALRRAGMTIDAVSEASSLVVGAAEVASLDDIALIEGVRWIEPTRDRPSVAAR